MFQLADSYDLQFVDVSWWRYQIAVVSQEPDLFDCTIAENIAYGDNRRHVTMDDIIGAAREANIHSFITALPQVIYFKVMMTMMMMMMMVTDKIHKVVVGTAARASEVETIVIARKVMMMMMMMMMTTTMSMVILMFRTELFILN